MLVQTAVPTINVRRTVPTLIVGRKVSNTFLLELLFALGLLENQ